MARHHLIISGTGRAGTTFLVQLLTQLGLDTGFTDTTSAIFPNCHAGMELDIRQETAPYIVKSPFLCDYLEDVIREGNVVIDHAILPVRDLYSAAQSRRHITNTTDPALYAGGGVPGGLWHTEDPAEQEAVLARQLYKIVFGITKHDIPMTLLDFPRFVYDPDYLYRKVAFALDGVAYESFLEAFRVVSRPELVHDFHAASSASERPDVAEGGEDGVASGAGGRESSPIDTPRDPEPSPPGAGTIRAHPADLRLDAPETTRGPLLFRLVGALRRVDSFYRGHRVS
jgi:hypothetical protein